MFTTRKSRIDERKERWGKSKCAFLKLHDTYENRVTWDIHNVQDPSMNCSIFPTESPITR